MAWWLWFKGVDEVVLSLYAKGLTTGELSAHVAEIYGASVSKETISRIADRGVPIVEPSEQVGAYPVSGQWSVPACAR